MQEVLVVCFDERKCYQQRDNDTALIVNVIIISRKTCMTVSGRYMDVDL